MARDPPPGKVRKMTDYELMFRFQCPECGRLTTGITQIREPVFRGVDFIACQWCDQISLIHWTLSVAAVRFDQHGNFMNTLIDTSITEVLEGEEDEEDEEQDSNDVSIN